MNKDYYSILGVNKDATADEIKSSFRKLSLLYHPDRQVGKSESEKKDAEEKFKEINEAYTVLSDPEKRQNYDQFGSADAHVDGGFDGFGGFDPFDMFRKMRGFGGFGSGDDDRDFDDRRKRDFDSPENGRDMQTRMTVSFKESVFGCTKEFTANLDEECHECHGKGIKNGSEPKTCEHCHGKGRVVHVTKTGWMMQQTISECPYCHGTGVFVEECPVCHGAKRIPKSRELKVKIPAGISDGQCLRVKGCGHCGVKGGSSGDMYVAISVMPSDLFERHENDIYVNAYISPAIATLGGKVEIPTLYGYKKIKIQPGSKSGMTMRIAGGGLKPSDGYTGDLYVMLIIEPYSNLDDEQKKLLEKLANSEKTENFELAKSEREKAAAFYG